MKSLWLRAWVSWGSVFLAACNPTFNWREVQFAPEVVLKAWLPCKPDRGSRPLNLQTQQNLILHMVGCEAGGVLFAVAYVDVAQADQALVIRQQWVSAMLANMQATVPTSESQAVGIVPKVVPKASHLQLQPVGVRAQGHRQDGSKVSAQGVWLAHEGRLYQAVVYADTLDPVVLETFFTGLRLP